MKAEFELNLDSNGRACIKFRHYNNDNSLDQKILKEFIHAANNGLRLTRTGGLFSNQTGESWDNYEINIVPTPTNK